MTQLEAAHKGLVTEAMKIVAADEGIDAETVRVAVVRGEAVIPLNIHHTNARPLEVVRSNRKIHDEIGSRLKCDGEFLQFVALA